MTRKLLKRGANVHAIEIVDLLLESGANLDRDGPQGTVFTPMGVAAQDGHTECVRRLLKAGATVNYMDTLGHTALANAVIGGDIDSVRLLLDAGEYLPGGETRTFMRRHTPYAGPCILHKPLLGDTLPVYVRDRYEEFANVVPLVELADDAIADYLDRNTRAVEAVVRRHGVSAMHANHAVLMSVVAQRVAAATGIPYAVMPHGSAIEYAVKRDARMMRYASSALAGAARIFAIGEEMCQRIESTFDGLTGLDERLVRLHLGVDTDLFQPIEREARPLAIAELTNSIADNARAQCGDDQLPDPDIETTLQAIDWRNERVLLFIGRLIEEKGPQLILDSLPRILAEHPDTRLVLVGHGPARAALEELARQGVCDGRVVFTGYLPHPLLCHLLPCADVAVFPSLVAEAGPLVFLEALAAGCFPLGTYFAGMAASIDSLTDVLPPAAIAAMKLSPDPEQTAADIAVRVPVAFNLVDAHKPLLRRAALERYQWKAVARTLAAALSPQVK